MKAIRYILATVLTMLLLYAATEAVQECTAGLFAYDNCLWLRVREELVLPQSKLLRAVTLELIGLLLLVGFYGTFRYVFPFGARLGRAKSGPTADAKADPPGQSGCVSGPSNRH